MADGESGGRMGGKEGRTVVGGANIYDIHGGAPKFGFNLLGPKYMFAEYSLAGPKQG